MSRYFRGNDEKSRARVVMLLGMVAETDLYNEPCPLFYSQINELQVLLDRIETELHKLRENAKESDL